MTLVDTNVLASLLVEERSAQRDQTLGWAERAVAEGDELVVTESVLVELCWVLERGYAFPRSSVAEAVETVVRSRPFRAWDPNLARSALRLMSRRPQLSITDCLLASRAASQASSVLTFDAGLANRLKSG